MEALNYSQDLDTPLEDDEPKRQLWPGQAYLLNDRTYPEHMLVSGNAYGKTRFGCRWHLLRCAEFNRLCSHSFIGAPREDILRDAVLPLYEEALEENGFSDQRPFRDYTINWSSGSMCINYAWGHKVLLRSMHNASVSKVVGFNCSHGWIDEGGQTPDKAPIEVTKRVRLPKATACQKLWTGTPEGVSGWFAAKLLDPTLQHKGKWSRNEDRLILHGRTFDNPTLKKEFLRAMFREFAWNPNLIKAYIYGQVVPLYECSGYDFDTVKHISQVALNPELPLYLGFDFNVLMTTWIAAQERGNDVHALAENKRKARTTYEACYEFIDRFPPAIWQNTEIIIWGDASGANRTANSYVDNYDIIKEVLKPKYPLLRVKPRKANPSVDYRVGCVNRLFSPAYPSSLYIGPECPKLQESLRVTTIDAMGKIVKPSGDTWTHRADALGYIIVELRPIKKPKHGEVQVVF